MKKLMDFESSRKLQELIGEWKAIWRSWKVLNKPSITNQIAISASERWSLLDRAARAEGSVEAILLQLSMERDLCECERYNLGLFRQYYQQLREAIRDSKPLEWKREDPEYWFSHELSIYATAIINKNPAYPPLSSMDAILQLEDILKVDSKNWIAKIGEIEEALLKSSKRKV